MLCSYSMYTVCNYCMYTVSVYVYTCEIVFFVLSVFWWLMSFDMLPPSTYQPVVGFHQDRPALFKQQVVKFVTCRSMGRFVSLLCGGAPPRCPAVVEVLRVENGGWICLIYKECFPRDTLPIQSDKLCQSPRFVSKSSTKNKSFIIEGEMQWLVVMMFVWIGPQKHRIPNSGLNRGFCIFKVVSDGGSGFKHSSTLCLLLQRIGLPFFRYFIAAWLWRMSSGFNIFDLLVIKFVPLANVAWDPCYPSVVCIRLKALSTKTIRYVSSS